MRKHRILTNISSLRKYEIYGKMVDGASGRKRRPRRAVSRVEDRDWDRFPTVRTLRMPRQTPLRRKVLQPTLGPPLAVEGICRVRSRARK